MDSDWNFNNNNKTQQNRLTATGKTVQELKDFQPIEIHKNLFFAGWIIVIVCLQVLVKKKKISQIAAAHPNQIHYLLWSAIR